MRPLLLLALVTGAPCAALAGGLVFDAAFWNTRDFTPAPFAFVDQTNVALGAVITSAPVTLTGSGTVAATATCDGCTLRRNQTGAFAASVPGFVNGDTIELRVSSSATGSTTVQATVAVGSARSAAWKVTTRSACGLDQYRDGGGTCRAAPADCRHASQCVTTSDSGLGTGAFVQTFLWDSGDCAGNDYCFSCAFGDVSTAQCQSGSMRCTATNVSDGCLIKVGSCRCL